MNINDQFESKYLKASDLQGRTVKAKIRDVTTETLGDDSKIVLYFAGKQKGMVCNRTNAMTLAEKWGPETDNWRGGEIEIFSMKVPFQGKLTDGLRVRPLAAARPHTTTNMAPNMPAPLPDDDYRGDDMEQEIPFAPEWR